MSETDAERVAATESGLQEQAERFTALYAHFLTRAVVGEVDAEEVTQALDARRAELKKEDDGGPLGDYLVRQIDVLYNQVIGVVKARRTATAEEALNHFEEALLVVRELQADVVQADGSQSLLDNLRQQELGLRANRADVKVRLAESQADREAAEAEQRIVRDLLAGVESPFAAVFLGMKAFQNATQFVMTSWEEVGRMNLSDALRDAEAARELFAEAKAILSRTRETSATDLPPALVPMLKLADPFLSLVQGFELLLAAQQNYVTCLHDSVVGEPTQRHVLQLEEAERLLQRGMRQIGESYPLVARFGGDEVDKSISDLESASDHILTLIRNLRREVKLGASVRQSTSRAAPMLVPAFLITLVTSLIALKLSGVVGDLGGTDVLNLTWISLLVAVGATFGSKVMLSGWSKVAGMLGGRAETSPDAAG